MEDKRRGQQLSASRRSTKNASETLSCAAIQKYRAPEVLMRMTQRLIDRLLQVLRALLARTGPTVRGCPKS